MGSVHFKLVVAESAEKAASDLLADEGGAPRAQGPYQPEEDELDILGAGGFEPLTIVACAYAVAMVLPVIVRAINDLRFPGGRLICLRGGDVQEIVVQSADQGEIWLDLGERIEHYPADRKDEALEKLGDALAALGGV